MPDARLQRTRDAYDGWISQRILSQQNMRYVGDGCIVSILNGETHVRILSDNDTRWLLPTDSDLPPVQLGYGHGV